MPEFVIYSKVGCKYCDKLAAILGQAEISYSKLTLGEDFTRDEFLDTFGKSTFPRVLLEGELIGGYTETAKYLVENKYV